MMAASPRIRNALTLFSSPDCVVCHRVRLVLAAKGVSYELVPVDTANPPEDLLDLNPYHSVPTLVDRDLVLYAASVVSEYLDERYPHPPLMPVDPLSRARLRLAMLRVELEWVPHVQAIQAGNKAQALTAIGELRKNYPRSNWLRDAGALEQEIRGVSNPDNISDEELKLLAIQSLMDLPEAESLEQRVSVAVDRLW